MKALIVTLTLLLLSSNLPANEVQELYSDSAAWEEFISNVEHGEKESIIKAIKLRKISDAGASSELNDALFVALQFEPQLILSSNKEVCFGRTDPLQTYKEALNELDTIINIVSKVNTEAAQDCVKKLESSKRQLARFFGVKTNGL